MSRFSNPGTEPPTAALETSFALRANDRPGSLPAALGCVIMASGEGKRFGGNKLMAEIGGRPMIDWVLDATQGIFARRVVVTRHPDVADLCRLRQVLTVLHDLPFRSDTVRLGLEAVEGDILGCMFCPADQPLLSRETVRTMAQSAAHAPEHIWQLAWGDAAGAPVIFPRSAFPRLRALPQGKGGSVLIKEAPERVRLVPAREPCELWDVDCLEDLKRITDCLER